MRIIRDNIKDLMNKTGHKYSREYEDELLHSSGEYYALFDQKENELLKITDFSLEDILYSKYYWFTVFTKRFHEIYGADAGVDQQQFKILEEISNRLDTVDYRLIENIDRGNI